MSDVLGMGGRLRVGASVEWWTPPHIFTALALDFDLDPCAPPGGVPWVPAARSYSIDEDGLSQPWEGRVWCNPPYGREAPRWVRRLADHGNGIALVFARTDPAWGQAALRAADAVCFVAGRISFIDGASGKQRDHAANSSMLLAFGQDNAEAVLDCELGVAFAQR